MDIVARLVALTRPTQSGGWSSADFLRAAREGKLRYDETEELFGIEYEMFRDAVAIIDPDFRLARQDELAIVGAGIPPWGHATERMALYFLKWERSPATAGLPNPYEPWVEIMEYGGYFQAEHGQFVDVFGTGGEPCGWVCVRRA